MKVHGDGPSELPSTSPGRRIGNALLVGCCLEIIRKKWTVKDLFSKKSIRIAAAIKKRKLFVPTKLSILFRVVLVLRHFAYFFILLKLFYDSEYACNICHWMLSNNQSANQCYDMSYTVRYITFECQ